MEKNDLRELISWTEQNSGSSNLEGLSKMLEILKAASAPLEADEVELIELPPRKVLNVEGEFAEQKLGSCLLLKKRASASKRVLLSGHMDTVYDLDHPFQRVTDLGKGRIQGPGITDMKGGLMVALRSLENLERSEYKDKLGWTLCISPDEEIGSPSSADILEKLAKEHSVGLIFEPCMADGSYINERGGSANVQVHFKGKSAHVGREFNAGCSAIVAAAVLVHKAHLLNATPGVTLNTGRILGGGPSNIVPDNALIEINIRVDAESSYDMAVALLKTGISAIEHEFNVKGTLHIMHLRPPKDFDQKTEALFKEFKEIASELGQNFKTQSSGGVCDGNILAAAGLPTIDTLGVRGGKIHSPDEYIETESLEEKITLVSRYLERLAKG